MNANFEIKEDPKSLNNPAWNPTSLAGVGEVSPSCIPDGKFIFLQTRRAVYSRVFVVSHSSDCIIIRYKKKEKKARKSVEYKLVGEAVQKRDIEYFRVYAD